ncbi:carbonic anhydrase [Nannochloropsis oceanica]
MRVPMLSAFTPFCRRATAACLTVPLAFQSNVMARSSARNDRKQTLSSPWTLPVRSHKHHPIWEDAELSHIFENNKRWVENALKDDPDFFKKLKYGQKPEYLYIGCSDSRVPAQEIMGLKAGEVFVARNIANLVVNTDMSLLAVLEYAVHVLEVKDIFVVGHYQCGGVKAAMTNKDHGLLEHWIRNIRDVQRIHKEELDVKKNLAIYKLYDFKNSGIFMKQALDDKEGEDAKSEKK